MLLVLVYTIFLKKTIVSGFFDISFNFIKFYSNSSCTNIFIMVYYLLDKLAMTKLAYIEIDNPKLFYVTFYYILIFSYMIYRELKIMKEQENGLQGYYKEY